MSGLLGPAAVYGQLLVLNAQPLPGLIAFGLSLTLCNPFHSVAGLLPSTGRRQSNDVSRRGTKLACRYAMLPCASANKVLFDELLCSSITFRNSFRFFAFVREYDCMSAFIGSFISRTDTHLPSASRTTGPWCVR